MKEYLVDNSSFIKKWLPVALAFMFIVVTSNHTFYVKIIVNKRIFISTLQSQQNMASFSLSLYVEIAVTSNQNIVVQNHSEWRKI